MLVALLEQTYRHPQQSLPDRGISVMPGPPQELGSWEVVNLCGDVRSRSRSSMSSTFTSDIIRSIYHLPHEARQTGSR